MSFAGSKTPTEAIEDLRQKMNELSGVVSGLMAYIASLPNASNINTEATLKLASSLTQKHVFALPGQRVDMSQEAVRAVHRILDLAKENKAV